MLGLFSSENRLDKERLRKKFAKPWALPIAGCRAKDHQSSKYSDFQQN